MGTLGPFTSVFFDCDSLSPSSRHLAVSPKYLETEFQIACDSTNPRIQRCQQHRLCTTDPDFFLRILASSWDPASHRARDFVLHMAETSSSRTPGPRWTRRRKPTRMTSPWRTKRPTAASISRAQGRLEKTGGAVQHATGHGDELAIDLTEYQARGQRRACNGGRGLRGTAWAQLPQLPRPSLEHGKTGRLPLEQIKEPHFPNPTRNRSYH